MKPKRKLFRLVGLLFPSLYLAGDALRAGAGRIATLALLTLFMGFMISLEWTRRRKPGVNRWIFSRLSEYTKDKERARISSTTWFLLATLLSLLLFDRAIFVAAILLLVFVDAVAEFAGTRWGKHPLLGKSLEGTLAGLLAGLAITLGLRALGLDLPLAAAVIGAVVASVTELLPIPIDDNFTVPLAAGAFMTMVERLAAGGPL